MKLVSYDKSNLKLMRMYYMYYFWNLLEKNKIDFYLFFPKFFDEFNMT